MIIVFLKYIRLICKKVLYCTYVYGRILLFIIKSLGLLKWFFTWFSYVFLSHACEHWLQCYMKGSEVDAWKDDRTQNFIYKRRAGVYFFQYETKLRVFRTSTLPFKWSKLRWEIRIMYIRTFNKNDKLLFMGNDKFTRCRVALLIGDFNFNLKHLLFSQLTWTSLLTVSVSCTVPAYTLSVSDDITIGEFINDLMEEESTTHFKRWIDFSVETNIAICNKKARLIYTNSVIAAAFAERGLPHSLLRTHLNWYITSLALPRYVFRSGPRPYKFFDFIWSIYDDSVALRSDVLNNILNPEYFNINQLIEVRGITKYICEFLVLLMPDLWVYHLKKYIFFMVNELTRLNVDDSSKFGSNKKTLRRLLVGILHEELGGFYSRDTMWLDKSMVYLLRNSLPDWGTLQVPVCSVQLYVSLFFYKLIRFIRNFFVNSDVSASTFASLFSISLLGAVTPAMTFKDIVSSARNLFINTDLSYLNFNIIWNSYYQFILDEFYVFLIERYIRNDINKLLNSLNLHRRYGDVKNLYFTFLQSQLTYTDFKQTFIINVNSTTNIKSNVLAGIDEAEYWRQRLLEEDARLQSAEAIEATKKAYTYSQDLFSAYLISPTFPYSVWASRWGDSGDDLISFFHLRKIFRLFGSDKKSSLWLQEEVSVIIKWLLIFIAQHLPSAWLELHYQELQAVLRISFNKNITNESCNILLKEYIEYIYKMSRLYYLDGTLENYAVNNLPVLIGRVWLLADNFENRLFLNGISIEKYWYAWGYTHLLNYFFHAFIRVSFILKYKSLFLELHDLCYRGSGKVVYRSKMDSVDYWSEYSVRGWDERYPGKYAMSAGIFLGRLLYNSFLEFLNEYKFVNSALLFTTANKKVNKISSDELNDANETITILPISYSGSNNKYFNYETDFYSDERALNNEITREDLNGFDDDVDDNTLDDDNLQ